MRWLSSSKAGRQQLAEPLGRVAGAQVAVLLVGLAERVAQPPQQRALEVGRVHHQAPARLRHAGELARERGLVGHVLEHVHDDHAVERGVGEGQPVPGDQVDVVRHQRADRRDRLLGEVARGPGAAALAQQQADDAVVGAEIEAAQARGGAERADELRELALLQDRAADRARAPSRAREPAQPRRSSLRMTGEPSARVRPSGRRRALERARERRPSRARGGAPSERRTAAGGRWARSRAPRTPPRSRGRRTP